MTGKNDPYEAAVADRISNYNWTVTFTGEELAEKVGASADIVSFQITETSATGNTIEITLTDANGKQYVESGDDCRTGWACAPSATPSTAAAPPPAAILSTEPAPCPP